MNEREQCAANATRFSPYDYPSCGRAAHQRCLPDSLVSEFVVLDGLNSAHNWMHWFDEINRLEWFTTLSAKPSRREVCP
jgi:hypothetical protein